MILKFTGHPVGTIHRCNTGMEELTAALYVAKFLFLLLSLSVFLWSSTGWKSRQVELETESSDGDGS